MARDSAVGRDRVLIVPNSLALDNASSQHPNVPQTDINQQILEVSLRSRFLLRFSSSTQQNSKQNYSFTIPSICIIIFLLANLT